MTNSTDSADARLTRVADIQEMRDVLARFCRGMDRCDVELCKAAFHAEATEHHGPFIGRAHDFYEGMLPQLKTSFEPTVRCLSNLLVEFDRGIAVSEVKWSVVMRDTAQDMFQQGRYLDRWERRSGQWKIIARISVVDWFRSEPRSTRPFYPDADAIFHFRNRGLDDPEVRATLGLPAAALPF